MKQEIDKTEKVIRIGCGALLGLVFGGLFSINLFLPNITYSVVFIILLVLIFSYLAYKKGDLFWFGFIDWFKKWF